MKFSLYCVVSTLLLAGSLPAIALADDTDLASRAGLPLEQTASRGIITRDPSTIVKCKDEFWVFYTGRGIASFHSKDLVKWEPGPPVFRAAPEWIAAAVPENRNMSYWAPDVIHLGDRYLLYYSVSSFGKINSAIGLAITSHSRSSRSRLSLDRSRHCRAIAGGRRLQHNRSVRVFR